MSPERCLGFTSMEDVPKLKRICRKCFQEEEWNWLSVQPNFMKLYEEMATLEDFEALCEVAMNMLAVNGEGDRSALARRLRENRDQINREWM